MKQFKVLSALALLGLSGCETFNQPLSQGGFDPLLTPGGANPQDHSQQSAFKGGDLVAAAMDNTAFFKNLPKGDADADRLLPRGTGMKVVKASGSYLQVELDQSGEVGWVPSVMVDGGAGQAGAAGAAGAYQVYPPLPGALPLPPGSDTLPQMDPAGAPPDGAIPTVVDPSLPSTVPPAPGSKPAATGATPPAAGTAAAPTPEPTPPAQQDVKPPVTPAESKPAEKATEKAADTVKEKTTP